MGTLEVTRGRWGQLLEDRSSKGSLGEAGSQQKFTRIPGGTTRSVRLTKEMVEANTDKLRSMVER